MSEDEKWMRLALSEAEAALVENEVPVGCVIVKNGSVIGRGHNRVEALKDPTAHAEILALTAAATTLNNWRLSGVTVYVTLEPCLMCTGALILSRVDRVVFGARDPKFGCLGSQYNIAQDNRFNHRLQVNGDVLAAESAELLRRFFSEKREEAAGRKG
ncbi:MAG: tRNA adenosine(34) deaminase TadA [candidate division WOR-3 bacterium]